MRTTWRDGDVAKAVTAPVSLIVSAFAPVATRARCLTPLLRIDRGETVLVALDLGSGTQRLGGSALAQVHGQLGDEAPDRRRAARLAAFFASSSAACGGLLLAYHDLATAACSRRSRRWRSRRAAALDVDLPRVDRRSRSAALFAESSARSCRCARRRDAASARRARDGGLARDASSAGPSRGDRVAHSLRRAVVLDESRVDLHLAWSATTHAMQRMRDNPACGRPGICAAARRRRSRPRSAC